MRTESRKAAIKLIVSSKMTFNISNILLFHTGKACVLDLSKVKRLILFNTMAHPQPWNTFNTRSNFYNFLRPNLCHDVQKVVIKCLQYHMNQEKNHKVWVFSIKMELNIDDISICVKFITGKTESNISLH